MELLYLVQNAGQQLSDNKHDKHECGGRGFLLCIVTLLHPQGLRNLCCHRVRDWYSNTTLALPYKQAVGEQMCTMRRGERKFLSQHRCLVRFPHCLE